MLVNICSIHKCTVYISFPAEGMPHTGTTERRREVQCYGSRCKPSLVDCPLLALHRRLLKSWRKNLSNATYLSAKSTKSPASWSCYCFRIWALEARIALFVHVKRDIVTSPRLLERFRRVLGVDGTWQFRSRLISILFIYPSNFHTPILPVLAIAQPCRT